MRIGHGYDAHRLKKGRKCILCGVEIPSDFGPDGHSDADVPLHALMDAMLGALALGDIGKLFPDTDEKWHMADSAELLRIVYKSVCSHGYALSNADITIILQLPRLAPYIDQMRARIAEVLEVDVSRISVKATTEERMGFTGDGTGIAAVAVVLLVDVRTLK
ncbi:MAG: 2-C-methyl-D-erythritol 2,4-cyclodiphosphate synthase [Oscillospiraceae bacterium]|nr:2-C-methyl-D-erythritol 2,4-cyclodiphosphate synthase [Oscillospiraceae bacterium]